MVLMVVTGVSSYDLGSMGQQFDDEFCSAVMAAGAPGPLSTAKPISTAGSMSPTAHTFRLDARPSSSHRKRRAFRIHLPLEQTLNLRTRVLAR